MGIDERLEFALYTPCSCFDHIQFNFHNVVGVHKSQSMYILHNFEYICNLRYVLNHLWRIYT